MPAKVKASASFKKKKERLAKLPTIAPLVIGGLTKKNAEKFIRMFHNGIKNNQLGLRKLAEMSISMKRGMGYRKPEVPLYGKGDQDKKKSYVNMLRIRKMKNGWKIFPSWGKHHKANASLRDLLKKHETGYTFIVDGKTRRVPPRPAWLLTKNKFLTEYANDKDNKKIKREIKKYIETGTSEWFNEMIRIFYGKYNDLLE